MSEEWNPQAEQMASRAMVRTLAAQAEAIWPQEQELVREYHLPEDARILDVACGTGEITARLAQMFTGATILGIDVNESHLTRASTQCSVYGRRVSFQRGNAFHLDFPPDGFDMVICRHLLQALPKPERVIDEFVRVTKPGGRIHLVAEDYSMIHFHPTRRDCEAFWRRGPCEFGRVIGTDLQIGRKMYAILTKRELRDVSVNYVVVDTLRVPREVFARIWRAWRDAYTDAIAENTELTREEILDAWSDMIACIEDPHGYAVWQVPVFAAVKGGKK